MTYDEAVKVFRDLDWTRWDKEKMGREFLDAIGFRQIQDDKEAALATVTDLTRKLQQMQERIEELNRAWNEELGLHAKSVAAHTETIAERDAARALADQVGQEHCPCMRVDAGLSCDACAAFEARDWK